MMVSIPDKQFVAGFIDGDGCIQMARGKQKYLPKIVVTQSFESGVPLELVFLHERFGGRLYHTVRKAESHRKHWTLAVSRRDEVAVLLEILTEHAIVKCPQAELALKYIQNPETGDCYAALAYAKKVYHEVEIRAPRLTNSYLAGFFAADGSVGIYRLIGGWSFKLTLAQTQCPALMRAIRDELGYGNLERGGGILGISNGVEIEEFLLRIQPYIVGQKMAQVDLALRFQRKRPHAGGRRTIAEKEEVEQIARELKRLKRL